MESLAAIQTNVELRVLEILRNQSGWPCTRGCDSCCRKLASLPTLTEPEWRAIAAALDALPAGAQAEIGGRASALRPGAPGPHVCPFLDLDSGACQVYDARPIACRTYGFYVERGVGLYCGLIEKQVSQGCRDDVVWGNQEIVDHALDRLAPRTSLLSWLASRG